MSEAQEVVVPTTPEQVLAAGGVSRRRRRVSGSDTRRRSPSGPRKRPSTPDPGRDVPLTDDESPVKHESEPEPIVRPARRKTTKGSAKHRSLSSPGDVGQSLPTEVSEEEVQNKTKDIKKSEKSPETNNFSDHQVESEAKIEHEINEDVVKNVEDENDKNFQITAERKNLIIETTKTKELDEIDWQTKKGKEVKVKKISEPIWGPFIKECRNQWKIVKQEHLVEYNKTMLLKNRCIAWMVILMIYCGLGGIIFRFTEGAFESFYKCGVKRVKRTLIDDLWQGNHYLPEDEWRSQARKKLMEFEEQLHTAHEAGVKSYSGQRAWSFLNAVVYCLTVVTTIGYGHISPSTTSGRAITIVYAIFGIPMFLILLADFGKLFTRGIKFLWAFVRRVYYTGSCRKVRRTAGVQEVMKGVQLVYDFATFRRPSQMDIAGAANNPNISEEDREAQEPLQHQPPPPPSQTMSVDGLEPGTPAPSVFEVDDEFNLPISVAIVILVIYIFCGAFVYWIWEDWGFFESFYFVFISMSTIGFGDFVPAHPMYMMASIVYLVFGLALTSMCINVVQEKLSDTFRHASVKIGATIGLQVSDEDGTITPVPVSEGEIPEVHTPRLTKSASEIPRGNMLAPPPHSMSM